jgi:hypothetical protein
LFTLFVIVLVHDQEDPTTLQWMETLLENIRSNHVLLEQGGGGVEN